MKTMSGVGKKVRTLEGYSTAQDLEEVKRIISNTNAAWMFQPYLDDPKGNNLPWAYGINFEACSEEEAKIIVEALEQIGS